MGFPALPRLLGGAQRRPQRGEAALLGCFQAPTTPLTTNRSCLPLRELLQAFIIGLAWTHAHARTCHALCLGAALYPTAGAGYVGVGRGYYEEELWEL